MYNYIFFLVFSVFLAVVFIPRDWSHRFLNEALQAPPLTLLSPNELLSFNGEDGSKGLYLALLGQVFDVSKGGKHYGPGGAYHSMAGKDASKAFVTGDFTESGLTDDVSGLSPLQVVALYDWLAFYHREYLAVGRVTGRFYTESGQSTEALLQVQASLAEGQRIRTESEKERIHFPACNSEWSAASGGRVWCSSRSGGVERHWMGFPRKLYSPGSSQPRCVCVENPSAAAEDPNLEKYQDCPENANSCLLEL